MRTPNSPKRYVELFAPSHSGKSMAITTYIEQKVVDEAIERGLFPADMPRSEIAAKQRIVLHVTLSPNASVRSLATDILRAFGDKNADVGTGPILLRRVYSYLNGTYEDPATGKEIGRQAELLILDEIQHLADSKAKSPEGKAIKSQKIESTVVTDTLKTMTIRGLVPMVFVGIPEARIHLSIDSQLTNRELSKIDFSPLRWSDEGDQVIFLEYCQEAAMKLTEFDLFPEETDLLDEEIPERLWAASGGCIGLVSRILEEAALHAVRRGASCVEYEDLELAVDTRAMPNNYVNYNPFREGVRQVEVVHDQ
ncbi:AAA family ATPase [Devosia elaeis]|uniref:AAA family ATPase n=1 Tax=Devosia elaeis TaxID=1770058 RepID=UPI003CCC029F